MYVLGLTCIYALYQFSMKIGRQGCMMPQGAPSTLSSNALDKRLHSMLIAWHPTVINCVPHKYASFMYMWDTQSVPSPFCSWPVCIIMAATNMPAESCCLLFSSAPSPTVCIGAIT